MNGVSKETFLKAEDSKVRDGLLYDMLEGIYNKVSFKRTITIAFLGGLTAAVLINCPGLLHLVITFLK